MDSYIYHHGIKGQRWGIRRFQNKDGSLTKRGKNRYNQKVPPKEQIAEPKKKGLTSTQKKILAIGAVAAAAALVGVGAYKLNNSRLFDTTLKAGRNFYRQGSDKERIDGLNELVYAVYSLKDSKKYKDIVSGMAGKASYTISSDSPVKIAGFRSQERIFNKVLQENQKFFDTYGDMKFSDFNGELGRANQMMIENGIKLTDTYLHPFFKELVLNGYDAIKDYSDRFAKTPVILLNMDGKFHMK